MSFLIFPVLSLFLSLPPSFFPGQSDSTENLAHYFLSSSALSLALFTVFLSFICFPYLSFQDSLKGPRLSTSLFLKFFFSTFLFLLLLSSRTQTRTQLDFFFFCIFPLLCFIASLHPTVAVPRPSVRPRRLLINTQSLCHNKTASAPSGAFPLAAFVETMLAVFLPSPHAREGLLLKCF